MSALPEGSESDRGWRCDRGELLFPSRRGTRCRRGRSMKTVDQRRGWLNQVFGIPTLPSPCYNLTDKGDVARLLRPEKAVAWACHLQYADPQMLRRRWKGHTCFDSQLRLVRLGYYSPVEEVNKGPACPVRRRMDIFLAARKSHSHFMSHFAWGRCLLTIATTITESSRLPTLIYGRVGSLWFWKSLE